MKLTQLNDWNNHWGDEKSINNSEETYKKFEWVKEAQNIIDLNLEDNFTSLELGSCPGIFSKIITKNKLNSIVGIDYLDCNEVFCRVNNSKNTNFLKYDLLTLTNNDINEILKNYTFNLVMSFGLIEHFKGKDLDRIIDIHTRFVNKDGLLIIELPNLGGIKYLWHYLFDRKNLTLHNLEIMNIDLFKIFEKKGFTKITCGYYDQPILWGHSSLNKNNKFQFLLIRIISKIINYLNFYLRLIFISKKTRSRLFSSFILYVGKKN